MAKLPTVRLPSGVALPLIGYGNGTALFKQDSTKQVEQALQGGYTLIDTAEFYANSQFVGAALAKAASEDVQVVAKVGDCSRIRQVALEEREKLQRKRLDVLLLHSPPRGKDGLPSNVEAWKQVMALKDEGVADVIGVSNWLASDIEEVQASKPKYAIEVNEIEHNPLLIGSPKQQKLLEVQKRYGIASMIYGSLLPITRLKESSAAVQQTLNEIASREQGWTPATVLFKWASQTTPFGEAKDGSNDGILITTTNKQERIAEYLALFESRRLTEQEVQAITEAGKKESVQKVYMVNYFEGRDE